MRRPLAFEQVRIRRAPGFERDGFTVPELSPGITIVYGPNGVGKSTTARAIERLLWPGLALGERMLLEGGVRLGEERWVVEAEGGRSQWLRDGVLTPAPRLPGPEVHHRYRLALHDLLREEDGDFAAAILRESAGGYDVRASGVALRPAPPRTRRNQKAVEDLRRAQAAYDKAVQEQRALRERERELGALRREREVAEEARARVSVLRAALEHARALQDEVEARQDLERYATGMEKLGGDEYERLCGLREKVREVERDRAEADEAAAEASRLRDALGLGPDALRDGLISGLEVDLERLRAAEQEVGRLRAAHDRARGARDSGMDRLGGVVDPERLGKADTADLAELSSCGRRLEGLAARRERIEQKLRAESASASPDDASRLEKGIGVLREWLREPRPSAPQAAPTSRLYAGTIAAILLVVVGVGGGVMAHPVFFVAVLAGVLLFAWMWGIRPAAPAQEDRAEAHRNAYPRHMLDEPEEWSVEAVQAHLEALEERLVAARAAARAAQNRAELEGDLAAVDEELVKLDDEVESVAKRLGVGSCRGANAVWVAETIGRWQALRDEAAGRAAELAGAEAERDALAEALRRQLEPFATGPFETLGAFEGAVRGLRDRREEYRRQDDAASAAASTARRLANALDERSSEISSIFDALGLEEGTDHTVQRWCEAHAEYRKVRDRHRETRTIRESTERNLVRAGGEEALAVRSEPELAALIEEEEARASQRDALADEITRIETLINRAMGAHDVEAALADVDRAEQALRDARSEEIRAAVAHELIEAVDRATREQQLPGVFLRARERFARITHGRYELRLNSGSAPSFTAYDRIRERVRALDELSSGTRVQLLLSVRVAFVEEQEEGVMLPLLLDEVLGNSDDERARAIMQALAALAAEGRQILYFTAKADEVVRWRGFAAAGGMGAVDLREIDLAAVRGDARRLEIPDAADPLLPSPPSPHGVDHAEYGRQLQVPRIDRAEGTVGAVHLWYLVEEPVALHGLLVLGADRWGPLQVLLQNGGRVLVDEVLCARLDALGEVLEGFLAEAKVGVGRRVDRLVLEESGVVTRTFIQRVSEQADAVEGDARRLLEVLKAGVVPRFGRQVEALRLFLADGGYLPSEDPLDLPEIRTRLLPRAAPLLHSRRLDPADLDRLLERLWIGIGGQR